MPATFVDLIVWDDDDDEVGNVAHIAACGLTPGDVDFVVLNHPRSHDHLDSRAGIPPDAR